MEHLLPSLKSGDENHVPAITKPGWHYGSASLLHDIATSLDVPDTSRWYAGIDAVPDPWARLLLFANALKEPKRHPLGPAAVGGFRGLLALLALRRRKKIQINVSTINLTAPSAEKFRGAISRLLPQKTIGDNVAWPELYIFTCQGGEVGITSPLTLVCPNDGAHRGLANLPWFNGRRLVDPIQYLSEGEKGGLRYWLRLLRESTAAELKGESEWRSPLFERLDEFEEALGGREIRIEVDKDKLGLGTNKVYASLKIALSEIDPSVANSTVLLNPNRVPEKNPKLLVFHPRLDEKLGLPKQKILLLDDVSFEEIQHIPIGSDRKNLGPYSLPAGVEWRAEEDLLTPKITLIAYSGSNPFPGAHMVSGQDIVERHFHGTPILPLKTELLDYFTAEHIRKSSWFHVSDDAIQFSVKLPLPNNGEFVLSRVYRAEDIRMETGLPIFEIWPNFRTPPGRRAPWPLYFTFWDTAGNPYFHAYPYSPNISTQRFPEIKGEREITRLFGPPEFINCETESGEGLGVLLVNLPPVEEHPPTQLWIGFDFGTTSTNIFIRAKGIGPLQMKTVTHQVMATGRELRLQQVFRAFLPTRIEGGLDDGYERAPFFSLFRVRQNAPVGALDPILHGHILFYHSDLNPNELVQGNVSGYLKWEEDNQNRVLRYLEQAVLHALAEGYRLNGTKFTLSFSYPTAFHEGKYSRYVDDWKSIFAWARETLNIPCEEGLAFTESVASGRYFESQEGAEQAFPAVGAVFVDIGGGTSDISIWQSNAVVTQSSIRLSGRELLLQILWKKRTTLLESIFGPVINEGSDSVESFVKLNTPDVFYRRMESILRDKRERVLKQLQVLRDQSKPLQHYITFGLAGLFYYIGLSLRQAAATGKYNRTDPTHLPKVHVGGNGSNLFHLIWPPQHSPTAKVNDLFQKMLFAGASWPDQQEHLEIYLSRHPKAEVAWGLVVESASGMTAESPMPGQVLAGEKFETVDGQTLAETSLLSTEQLKSGIRVPRLTELDTFLKTFNAITARHEFEVAGIPDSAGALRDANSRVQQWLHNQASKQEAKRIEIEPLFIIGFKRLLEQYLENAQ